MLSTASQNEHWDTSPQETGLSAPRPPTLCSEAAGGEILTSGGRCRCFRNCPRPAVGMFSHRMNRQVGGTGCPHQVTWPYAAWAVGLATNHRHCGHLNRAAPCRPWLLICSQRAKGGDRQPHQTPGATALDTLKSHTHTDGHTAVLWTSSSFRGVPAANWTR